MANVLFKRGLKGNLPQENTSAVVDGALYFTTDTCQLYLGNGQKLLPIGDNIRICSDAALTASDGNLGPAADHKHEFAYITDGNIMAWSDGTHWVQTNPDTRIANNGFTSGVVTTTDGATVTLSITDSAARTVSTAISIVAGSENVTVSTTTDGEISIAVDPDTTYTLTTSLSPRQDEDDIDDVDIVLTPSAGQAQIVKLKDSNSVNVLRNNDGSISFAVDNSGIGGIASYSMGNGNGKSGAAASTSGFYGDITGSNAAHYVSSIDPVIVYGEGADQTVHFNSGTATLSIYTKSEIDTKIQNLEKNLDAMTYKGTTDAVPSSSGVHLGDTWKANDTFTISAGQSSTGAAVTVEPGYLIIANGTEGADGTITSSTLKFDVIAGDTDDTTITITEASVTTTTSESPSAFVSTTLSGIKVTDSQGVKRGGLLVGGVNGQLTSTARTVTLQDGQPVTQVVLGLADKNATTVTTTSFEQTAGGTSTVTLISGVLYDSKGRVETVQTKEVTLVDTKLSTASYSISASSNVATITFAVSDTAPTTKSDSFALTSSGSITVTASAKTINVDLVWGTF